MSTTQVIPPKVQIGGLLESAVILSWNELLKSSLGGLVHIEYGTAPEASLQYVKIWLATPRGAWNLICEYWISSGFKSAPPTGLTFSNGFHSAVLAEILEAIMHARQGFVGSFVRRQLCWLDCCSLPDEGTIAESSGTHERSLRTLGACLHRTCRKDGVK